MAFRLLTYNIRVGGVGRLEPLARIINACHADLVLLQEATRPALVHQLAVLTGMADWRAFPRQSLGYMSREPVSHASWHQPRLSHHAYVEVMPAGLPLRVFGVHLSAVHAAWTERRRVYELRALLREIADRREGLHVLAGDFNTLAPGARLDVGRLPLRLRPFVWLSGGRIKWRTIQTVLDAGYADAFRVKHPDDAGLTVPAGNPQVRLDYAFVPATYTDRIVACDVVRHPDAAAASDHYPVVLDLAT
ncbi:MAG: exodeoxyribonuclease (xth) [Acidobacteria bacterium]|nr:exodeoxyribonuclease (xth) [Acidobacteriota bacterium]